MALIFSFTAVLDQPSPHHKNVGHNGTGIEVGSPEITIPQRRKNASISVGQPENPARQMEDDLKNTTLGRIHGQRNNSKLEIDVGKPESSVQTINIPGSPYQMTVEVGKPQNTPKMNSSIMIDKSSSPSVTIVTDAILDNGSPVTASSPGILNGRASFRENKNEKLMEKLPLKRKVEKIKQGHKLVFTGKVDVVISGRI